MSHFISLVSKIIYMFFSLISPVLLTEANKNKWLSSVFYICSL